ncbi:MULTISPECIES: ABC transporter ATP-binding protein [Dethiosulfovibrio]|jgi:ABC-type glutathione transport system ATPase component|uniref:ABC transporter ATP-binding protein n=2 Tax=Dethiosulfovibrio TaxID=47054 RepID=A0ABS9EJL1_9BACT|nr:MULTISPECIES: ABC transporter ATP-binding protein [Dethiosulfovibrio]MCF4112925.1 ABC transporter ATP-binding protein [Dethiosulfovibrio russensis]MCF4141389.1 ABC transporter ATP-binding protein [Dethiosulfovibrio marinus]MCF4144344.1 ABC transporter ATP-binding protein [Dethiosulfovibrio acidaminovorans]
MMVNLSNLSVRYPNSPPSSPPALDDVSLSLRMGEILGLVGESGSGKSTLLMAILRLLPKGTFVKGTITSEGQDLLSLDEEEMRLFRWDRISLVPQGAMNGFTPVLTVGYQIAEVLLEHSDIPIGESSKEVRRLLSEVGLPEDAYERYPHELSGGQKQRAAIATALACAPYFLLADEPTTALDVITQAEVISLLRRAVKKRNMGMVLVTHDIALASSICDSIAVLRHGKLVDHGTVEEILSHPTDEHTKSLLRAQEEMER